MNIPVIHGEGELRASAQAGSAGLGPRYPALDALRFVLAFWVAVGHYQMFPLFAGVNESTPFGHFLTRGWNTLVFGTPAVIVFFVISGFCIHIPFIGDKKMAVGRYYARRYTRILIPVAAALCVYRLFGQRLRFWGEHSILWESPLWSLLCEEVYYAAYPLLRYLRRLAGWTVLLSCSFVAAIGIALTNPHAPGWHPFGPLGTATILLPVWLLGALLAEQAATLPALTSAARIWFWRLAAWAGCWSCEMLHFKAKISYTTTMIAFGVLAFFWVKKEIEYSRHRAPNKYLIAAGAWSYSLYLVHVQGVELFGWLPIPYLGYIPEWCLRMLSSLLFAYVFYALVERPSHRLARSIKLSGPARTAPASAIAPQRIGEAAP
jgi:peptidoglycan/LPS O-acetylase OafA/YrhL